MSIEGLAIEGIPRNDENLRILQELPLHHLACDLTDRALSLLQSHAALQGMNHHTAAYLNAIYHPLQQAFTAWRHPECVQRPALHQYAVVCGNVRYLALPIRLSHADADAFSRFNGGMLACPMTDEQMRVLQLHMYLTSLVKNDSGRAYFHPAIVPSPGWQEGMACCLHFSAQFPGRPSR